ncbi:MAG: peptide-methionine (S)-S-oxide reductase [Candidatus Pelagibacter sp.]
MKEIELQYSNSVVTYVREFDKFYKAEDYHQNYYQTNFINYLLYKKGCGRESRLEQIWKK